ncbi:hypothetical protein K461DRAFT_280218 [Myriangium duriaei CBS 260.36]|uniref:Fork-head domain-containing protein n=1 Tax=Myriangium duriaei CBS 260.36 TaxID=1168546 RepID=A0A9P4J2X8_9PEZI|nr:hypothetical protein K461DRAFT_280218 [Myriangium duriaei CBS 260.36]
MAAATNALAPFGPPQTPQFPPSSPYNMTDGLIKHEDTADQHPMILANSPTNVAPNHLFQDLPVFAEYEDFAPPPVPDSTMQADIESLRDRSNRSMSLSGMPPLSGAEEFPEDFAEDASAHVASIQADLESYAAEEAASVNVEPMQAYAKLQFADGDFYVSTQAVELGRDLSAMKHERRARKQERRKKEQATEVDTPAQLEKAHLKRTIGISGSNASESGGIIGNLLYSGSEDEAKLARRRRKKFLASNDSSQSQSHSVAPASLHTNPNELSLTKALFDADFDPATSRQIEIPFVPIHPAVDRSITGISRKHIRIEYNSEKSYWELHVLGRNGAFVDDENFLEKGAVARLRHNSHIQVQGIDIVFKLPDNAREEEELAVESDAESELSKLESSPEAGIGADEHDSAASSDPETPAPKERVKLKLSLSKRGQALNEKTQKASKLSLKAAKDKDKDKAKDKDHDGDKDNDKTVAQKTIPGGAEVESVDIRPSIEGESTEVKPKPEPAGVPATPAPDLPPGSILAGLAPEEIPQKRKGPGRPPKNGVMSKRDEAIIKRKKKELQKAGREIPPLTELLAMARAEAGTTKKGDEAGEGETAVPSSGTGTGSVPAADGTASSADPSVKTQTAAEIEAAKARKQAKSPSPQKPESEYTEEELKKPQKTYVVLIHDALSASTTGIMDLQQIYDAIQKMYPYYKYKSQTQGWQSSIRHNLIGSEAFEEAGKIGKGRLWKINPNYPIDKEKKRRAPTPPTDKPSYPYYQNGQYQNNSYPAYRPSPYGTPYGPPTTAPNGARPPPPPTYGQQRNGTYYSPYATNPAGQNHASPYGAQSRPPYAHAPNQPGNANPTPGGAASNQNTASPAPRPAGPPNSQPQTTPTAAGRGQPPRSGPNPPPPGQPQQQGSIGSDDTIEEIMSYHKRYLGGFKQGAEQDAARDLFRKAVSRHIDHNKEHGEYTSEEEKKVADVIGEIIRRNKGKAKPPMQQARPVGPAGGSPQQGAVGGPQQHAAPARPAQQAGTPTPTTAPNSTGSANVHVTTTHAPAPATMQHKPPTGPSPTPVPTAPTTAAHASTPVQHQTQARPPVAGPAQPTTIDLTGPTPAATQVPRPSSTNPPAAPTPRTAGQAPQPPPAVTPTATPPTAAVTSAPVAPMGSGVATGAPVAGVKRAAEDGTDGPDAKKAKS